ncbi:tripartite tricarboxylate transporter substrate binding protein [Clostridium sp. AM58-1XD]|uniref:Bug family tripartite tricarboxylate transporter substrate binding protein n=1 Tax=Clostridium sp. AM58-1XD TaxID=2292307 RepID=UPI000E4AEF12|nr:tripartite tricarboxylate transporter substrate binding protein [Clostridium sp. AM58-1XD]RGY99864.1 tripartite tricarboxylate transporter substrate binding protein [Clostridium sp. AM58-1XD]
MKKMILGAAVWMCMAATAGCSGTGKETSKTDTPKTEAAQAVQTGEKETGQEESGRENAWKPEKNIEWVVTSSAGGGSDIYTRMISDIMKKEGLVDQTILVNNQTDGGGEVGRLRVSQEKSDGHLLLTFNSGDLVPMVTNTDNRIENFRPIAVMAVDRHLLLKGKATPYADLKTAIQAAKDGTKVTVGGSKGEDYRLYNMLLSVSGLTDKQLTYIMYDATSDAITSLLGGHIDYCISKPASSIQYMESGDVEAEAALAKERFGGSLSEVPLLSEVTGLEDIEAPIWRGIVGPASMPDEAVQFWSDTMGKVAETEEWKNDYIEKNMLTPLYIPAEEAATYMKDYQDTILAEK